MTGMPASRITDMHICPMVTGVVPHVGGPVLPPCAITVLTGNLPQARVGDMCTCVGPPDVIMTGAWTVLVMGKPAARLLDTTAHGGKLIFGWPTVLIGGAAGTAPDAGQPGAMPWQGGPGGNEGGGWTAPAPTSIASGKQADTLKQAAKDGTPFCEECQN